MTGIMTELILRESMENARAGSSLAKPKVDDNVKIELSKEHLMELRKNAYRGTEEEDIVDHIAKVLEIVDLIKTPNMDTDQLRVHVFPFSLTNEGPDFFEFEAWLNSKFNNHRRMDGMTKSALWHYWVKGEGNNELMDDIESSNEEWEEFDYGNPPNTDTNSF
ncbi:hypothetical protein Tco_1348843, partial [Tanacetum coccineum]